MSAAKKKNRKNHQNPKKKNTRPGLPWVWIGAAILALVILGGAVLLQQGGAVAPTAAGQPDEITVQQTAAKYEAGAFLLDVRTPEEWEEYHIPNTTLIPLDELESRLSELPRDQEIVVVCRSGNRSATGRDILRQAGFEQVTSMAGGLKAWSAAGYDTVSGVQ